MHGFVCSRNVVLASLFIVSSADYREKSCTVLMKTNMTHRYGKCEENRYGHICQKTHCDGCRSLKWFSWICIRIEKYCFLFFCDKLTFSQAETECEKHKFTLATNISLSTKSHPFMMKRHNCDYFWVSSVFTEKNNARVNSTEECVTRPNKHISSKTNSTEDIYLQDHRLNQRVEAGKEKADANVSVRIVIIVLVVIGVISIHAIILKRRYSWISSFKHDPTAYLSDHPLSITHSYCGCSASQA